ncbi:inner membrane-spanning protein YciB [Moraxella porci]|uniref:Inner membrane-spanning protein YciB n=1 Tax=Moraxella porci DSM 25326 TaxID=573983 RepID=A0A1T0CSL0_9GAMM|nr:septation protein IspZ [Moraxella porci]MDH2273504.1 septation protein IspZ [Moraxella porci]OOS25326.1 septation protein A [Moraxella porci DSM 25326]
MKALFDYIPLILFFVLYKTTEPTDSNHPILQLIGASGGADNNHILVATAGLIAATIAVYGYLFISQKFRLEKQQWFVLLMTVVFGGITLALSDAFYIMLKAVLINAAFAIGLLISPLFTKDKSPIIKRLFEPVFDLTHAGWQRLNLAWVAMFGTMAGLHAFFAFVFADGKYWGEFTAFGDMIVMFGFIAVMFFSLRRHIRKDIQ